VWRKNNVERELDKLVDAAIEDAFIEQRERYNYEEEMANEDEFCCFECRQQAAYFL
jgi:hypothetical protein